MKTTLSHTQMSCNVHLLQKGTPIRMSDLSLSVVLPPKNKPLPLYGNLQGWNGFHLLNTLVWPLSSVISAITSAGENKKQKLCYQQCPKSSAHLKRQTTAVMGKKEGRGELPKIKPKNPTSSNDNNRKALTDRKKKYIYTQLADKG